MTGRYRHWMTTAREGHWPTGIVCVDCTSATEQCGRGVNGVREVLTGWHAVNLAASGGEYVQVSEMTGTAADAFVRGVADESTRSANLWIVSSRCQRVWSLLGVWEGLEDGTIAVCDRDYRNSQAFADRLRTYRANQAQPLRPLGGREIAGLSKGANGYLVVEDCPNILHGRMHGSCHGVTWVDVRNYGCEIPSDVATGFPAARWISDVMRRMCSLCRANGLTALKATAGSQAMSAWRHSHLTERVYVHTDQRAEQLETAAYGGGRCEATRIGVVRDVSWHLDFRSQYGWVCANCKLPVALRHYGDGRKSLAEMAGLEPGTSIADVEIATDEPAYPVRRDGEVIYPVGRYRTVLCGPELTDALERGRVMFFHAVATYRMGYPLKSYAESLYALRCAEEHGGNPAVCQWIKRLIVSLPGKLGQRSHRWVDCPHVMPQCMYGEWFGEDEDGGTIRYRAVGGVVQRDCVSGFASDSVPAMAAFVTSFARIRLLNAIRSCGWGNVHYYDTDSLIVNKEGYLRLRDSEYMMHSGMGQLTERERIETLDIRGVKYYVHGSSVTCAGLPRGNIVDCGDGTHYQRHISAIEQTRRGQRPEAVCLMETYPRTQEYRQGVVRPDGRVVPFVLSDGG